jgi:hypothetical protein
MNNFQKDLLNKNTCWEIVKIFHPEISEELKDKLIIDLKYDWV